MEIDIRTLVIILGFTHLMQVLVFYHQFRVNKTYSGIGWWLLWSAAEVIGFGFMLLRGIPSILPIVIIVQNFMIVAGTVFLYVGVRYFLDKKANQQLILTVVSAFTIGFLYFLFVNDSIQVRSGFISVTLAFISFITAFSLFTDKSRTIKTSANFNALIFLLHGGIFLYRFVMILKGEPVNNIFASSFFNLISYLDALIVSLLWTFGLIIMLNQRLNAELLDKKNDFELIFNTSPDGAIITRVEDGLIVNINEGYTTITGYSREEMIGKLTPEINIWKNIDDRQKVVAQLKKQGHCENFEAVFVTKNGDEITGLMSAKIINIRDSLHIISMTRNISDRKQMEEAVIESELKLRLLFENMDEGVALHEMIYNDAGIPVDYRIVDVNSAFERHTGISGQIAHGALATILYGVKNPPYLTEYSGVVQSGKPISFETHSPILNKKFRISAVSTKPRYFATIFQDITERTKKEAEISFLLEKAESSRNNLLSILEDQMIAQESLKVSEERYRSLLTNLEAGVVVHAPNTSIIMYNNRAAMLLGLRDEQMKGKLAMDPHWKFIGENNVPLHIEEYPVNRILATKKPFNNFILGVVKPSISEITWLTVNGFPVLDNNNKVSEILISFMEITERKKAEKKLKENLALLRIAGEKAKLGGWIVNLEENRSYWSDELAAIHGMPAGYSPTVEDGIKFYAPEWHDRITNVFSNCATNGIPYDEEMEIITANGKRIWIRTIGEAVMDPNGIICKVHGAFQDISERKQAERALQLKNFVFDASLAANSISDLNGLITELNEAFVKIWGYTNKNEVIGKPLSEFIFNPEETNSILLALQGSGEWVGNYTAKKKDGSTFIAYSVATVVKDESGSTIGYQSAVLDVTEEKKAKEEIIKLNKELEQRVIQRTAQLETSNKELEAFSYSVSHDLRAPLRAVNSYTNILLEDYGKTLDEDGKRICGIISSGAKQMGELIDDLLNFSRIGRSSLDASLLDMKVMASVAFAEIAGKNGKARTKLKIGKLQKAYGDAHLIRLVWNNLISNAIKYSSKMEISEISIGSQSSGNNITYYIKDNGVGFEMLYKHKLFGVFQRLHSEKDFEGNGVGLAIVQRIINKHGGKVWAEGEVDKGATFYFSLPASDEEKGYKMK